MTPAPARLHRVVKSNIKTQKAQPPHCAFLHLQIYQKLPIFETKDNETKKMYYIHKNLYPDNWSDFHPTYETDSYGLSFGLPISVTRNKGCTWIF